MGLRRKMVVLCESTDEWKIEFEVEKETLIEILKNDLIDIQHVGSTAIPGLKAKPIIDIAIAVRELDDILRYIDELAKNGYEFRGNAGVEGRYFFVKGGDQNVTHYLHVEPIDSLNWESHIFFRDYLIENPKLIKEYENLKIELSSKYPDERPKYTAGKSEFIGNVIREARKYYKKNK